MIDKANIRRNLSRLMAAKSISGTSDEIQGAEVILDMLHELDYFKAHSENIFTVPVEGDQLGRYIVAALMCGIEPGDEAWRRAMSMMASISVGPPVRWTAIMALVLSVIFSSTDLGSRV